MPNNDSQAIKLEENNAIDAPVIAQEQSLPQPSVIGRPLKYQSPEEIEPLIRNYFQECDDKKEPYLITGLCLALDITRQQLSEYAERPAFQDTIKKARMRVENYAEKDLHKANGQVAGPIFKLKSAFGWQETTEVKHTHRVERIERVVLPDITLERAQNDYISTTGDDKLLIDNN